MKKSITAFLMTVALISVFVFEMPAIADDASFEGDGASVVPIKNNHVQMVSETIKMYYVATGWKHWEVDVTMNFHNHGPATNIQMGFPFNPSHDPDQNEQYDKEIPPEQEPPEYNFKSYVNGTEVKTVTKNGDINPKLYDFQFIRVMTFKVKFDKNENKVIRHTYSIGGTHSSNGAVYLRYILRTGGLWRGVIEDCKITVEAPSNVLASFDLVSPKEHAAIADGDKLQISWSYQNLKPDFDIELTRIPDDLKTLNSAQLLNYLKQQSMYTSAQEFRREYTRYFRNRVVAKYGRKFDNAFVKAQFADLPEQNSISKYDPSKMSAIDKELLHFLDYIDNEMAIRK